MSSLVTKQAPEFKAQAVMPDNSFKEIKLSDYKGKYVVLFFYPLDFTFVCPSEILAFDKKIEEFKERNCELIGFLIDREGTVKHATINDLGIGRNVDETLRVLDALQFTEEHGEVCPANWKKGEDAMKPTAEGVAEYLSKHN